MKNQPKPGLLLIKGTVFYIVENSKNQIRIEGKNIIIVIRARLVHGNDYYVGIRISITMNTLS